MAVSLFKEYYAENLERVPDKAKEYIIFRHSSKIVVVL